MNRPTLTRCPAPARTEWGTLRCVTSRDRCDDPAHRKWTRLAWPMALAWAVKPWWPNAAGRAADRRDPGQTGRGKALLDRLNRIRGAA